MAIIQAAPITDVRRISAQQLAQLGLSQIAYVKPVTVDGARAFAIYAADGTQMALAGDRELAVTAIQEHDMAAVLVH